MGLLKFRFIARTDAALWMGNTPVKAGTCKAILGFESQEEADWFMGRLGWSSWRHERVNESAEEPRRAPGRPPKVA